MIESLRGCLFLAACASLRHAHGDIDHRSGSDRRRLEAVVRDRNAAQKHAWRAEIILSNADGIGTNDLMRRTGKSKTCDWRWQERFMEEGFEGPLRDKTRPSRIKQRGNEVVERIVAVTLTDPPAEATNSTGAMMAKVAGVSVSSVQPIWRAHGLPPHRVRQFKLTNDRKFIDKLHDVVGLYVDPPAHAIVPSVDEKSQIQAFERTQPGLQLKKGRAGTMTHDYKLHGTTRLFAALNVLDGKVIGRNMQRHRHQEFIRFLNAVEGFFAKLTKRRLKRGVFRSIVDLQAAINLFLDEHNAEPKPFTWTADPEKIIAALRRGHQALDSIH